MQEFRTELAALKSEMISRSMFDQLENRVTALEQQGLASPDLSFLCQQVNRLDPAHCSIRVRGLKQSQVNEREESLEKILDNLGVHALCLTAFVHQICRGLKTE